MSYVDIGFFIFLIVMFVVGFGVYMGYSMSMTNEPKNVLVAFLDGWLIALPSLLMIALFAPILLFGYSLLVIAYWMIKLAFGEFVWTGDLNLSIAYLIFVAVALFWIWFRKRVLGYRSFI